MRLDKFLSHNGFGTRKEVKALIKQQVVTVNGVMIKSDKFSIDENNDIVVVDGIEIEYSEYVYYMLNKPKGYISATEDNNHPVVTDLIDNYYRNDLFPVGRLDIDTTGLLLLTNDGKLAHQLLSPKKHVEKEYIATIDQPITKEDINLFKQGIELDDFTTHPSTLKVIDDVNHIVSVIIDEGKFHQVKRMFNAVNKNVLELNRIRMKNLVLDESLEQGEYRPLSEEEINDLKEMK